MVKLCMTPRYGAESFKDKVSITEIGESLDIADMLERAQQGILDLSAYSVPTTFDCERGKEDELLNRESSVLDNVFGASREEVIRERDSNLSVAKRERTKKSGSVSDENGRAESADKENSDKREAKELAD